MIDLYTEQANHLPAVPHADYPRPTLQRESFLCLNGKWDFAVTRSTHPPVFDREILVPFAPESLLSGIHETFVDTDVLWYKRRFTLPDGFQKERVLLHFEAVDQYCSVLLNGTPLGEHEGGYQPFTFDITEYLKEENELAVRVTDRLDSQILPYGKQKRKRGGMWYTPTTGIWQSVWLESVPKTYIRDIRITPTLTYADIALTGVTEGTVHFEGRDIPLCNGYARLTPDTPIHWSPENPHLYEFTLTAGEDVVTSYFALRTVDVRTVNGIPRLCLNEKPYFFHGLLDQGYWSDGGMTPADATCYIEDIKRMKALGFNMLRKHIKVEARRFYYECDRLGMIVFQDMVNNSDYSFLRDTALPTLGFLRKNDKHLHRRTESRIAFTEGMKDCAQLLYNHPCICLWTIFNEGWGQFDSSTAYRTLKSIDPTRPVDTASGWFLPQESDVDSRHIYFRKLKLTPSDKPLFLSEFGGLTYKVTEHITCPQHSYGYGTCPTRQDFVTRFCDLYEKQVLPLISKGLCAAVYTQVSDVEEEINGLLTYDRKVEKITPEEFLPISQKLIQAIDNN